MKTWIYLTGPDAVLFAPAVAAAIAVALACGLLSVPVVLRRLAFIGHGVAHAAFGGVGLAAVLGFTGASVASAGGAFLIVGVFCVLASVGVAVLSTPRATGVDRPGERPEGREDTVIGLILVGSMALGALLLHLHTRRGGDSGGVNFESSLFGSIVMVRPFDALAAWAVAILVVGVLVAMRRVLVFWAFDEPAAQAFGVRTDRVRLVLMALLGVAVVATMKLAGVLLTTALLVLPGAAGLAVSRRLVTVVWVSVAVALAGMLGGLVLCFETDWPPGPSVVVVLLGLVIGARLAGGWTRRA